MTKRARNDLASEGKSPAQEAASPALRINTVLTGDPAKWYEDWKRRGIVRSAPDAVRQAFQVLNERLTELQLKNLRLLAEVQAEQY